MEFGPYVLHELLGRGGMGEVYRATDTVKNRTVAVKRLPRELAADETFQARFRRESRLAARLNAPHIIPIHDFGEIDGHLFIDMRLVEGSDLAGMLKRTGPLPPAVAVDVLTQVASALDDAHSHGLVHRDVKPSNILLTGAVDLRATSRPFAYLVDFGIAAPIAGYGGEPMADVTATTSTAMVGTLAYMAPERIDNQPSDQRADVYSLACVLFECLTGTQPFRGATFAVMYAHLHQVAPPLGERLGGMPPELDAVIRRGMAKDPAKRFAAAGALMDAAREALVSLATGSAPARVSHANQQGGPVASGAYVPPGYGTPHTGHPVPPGYATTPPGFATPPPGYPAPPSGPSRPYLPILPPPARTRRGLWVGAGVTVAAIVAAAAIVLATRDTGATTGSGTARSTPTPTRTPTRTATPTPRPTVSQTRPADVPDVPSSSDPVPVGATLPAIPAAPVISWKADVTIPVSLQQMVEYAPAGLPADEQAAITSVERFMLLINKQDFSAAKEATSDPAKLKTAGYSSSRHYQVAFGIPRTLQAGLIAVPQRFVSRQTQPNADPCTYYPQHVYLVARENGRWLVDLSGEYVDEPSVMPILRSGSGDRARLNPSKQEVPC